MGANRQVFVERHWDASPLLTRAASLPRDFTDLLSPNDVDSLVAERGLRRPFFRLVKDGKPVTGGSKSGIAGSQELTDLADNDAIAQMFSDGATLALQSLQRLWPPVAAFCRDLAVELGHPTQCNGYVTPGGDSRGLAFHHDTHDVFVLQVAGRKRWQVHRPVVSLPTPRQARAGTDLVPFGQVPLLDVELEPGDCLYLPRGFVHAAGTTRERSLHLTIGVHPTTWYDVIRDATLLAADDEGFRHALPIDPMRALQCDPDLAVEMIQRAAAWLAALPADRVSDLIEQRLLRVVRPESLGVLRQAEAVEACSLSTTTRPRRGLRWSLATNGGRVVMKLPDRTIDLPDYTEGAVSLAMSSPHSVRDFVGGRLDADGAVVLVKRLLRDGALIAESA